MPVCSEQEAERRARDTIAAREAPDAVRKAVAEIIAAAVEVALPPVTAPVPKAPVPIWNDPPDREADLRRAVTKVVSDPPWRSPGGEQRPGPFVRCTCSQGADGDMRGNHSSRCMVTVAIRQERCEREFQCRQQRMFDMQEMWARMERLRGKIDRGRP